MSSGEIKCGTSETTAAVVFRDTLYVFHQGWKQNGKLFYTQRREDGSFAPDQEVPGVGLSRSPAVVVYRNDLYIFYQGWGNCGQLWFSIWRANGTWERSTKVADDCLSHSPRACVYDDYLYVFYHGPNDNGKLKYRLWSGVQWWGAEMTINNVKLTESPSPVISKNKLYVFYRGRDEGHDKVLHWTIFDGRDFTPDRTDEAWKWSKSSNWLGSDPWPVASGDGIHIFFREGQFGNCKVFYRSMNADDSWSDWRVEFGTVGGWWGGPPGNIGPNVAVYRDVYYVFMPDSDSWMNFNSHKI